MKIKTTKIAKTIDSKDIKHRQIVDLQDFPTLVELPANYTDQPGIWCYLDDRDPERVHIVWSDGNPSVRHSLAVGDEVPESYLQELLAVIGNFQTRKDLLDADEIVGSWTGDEDVPIVAGK